MGVVVKGRRPERNSKGKPDVERVTQAEMENTAGRGFLSGLSVRLLLLTVAFLLLGEVLIFVPSIARFRLTFLEERLASAHLASLALDATPDANVPLELESTLLSHAKVASVSLQRPSGRELMLGRPMVVDASFRSARGNTADPDHRRL